MTYDQQKHHRRSIRLKKYDYSSSGAYFITICTQNRRCLFGEIKNGIMCLNHCGQIVNDEWIKTSSIRKEIKLDDFVIMPNHMHAILIIKNALPIKNNPRTNAQIQTLGTLISGFKSVVTKRINTCQQIHPQSVWQRNYWERVIRSDAEFYYLREYIKNNPSEWINDRLYMTSLQIV